MNKTIEDRIKFLEKCANLYETSGNSPLTDVEYDKEYAECQKLNPNHSFFSKVGGLDEEHIYGTPFTHKYVMGSLNKSPNTDDFEEWIAKTHPDTNNLIAVLDLKVDGSSLCLHYENGKLIRVVTRGNGKIGIDVTPNGMHIKGILHNIKEKDYVEIKGECYKDRDDFYKKWSKDVGGDYENPRNFCAGSINQKDPLVTKERGLSFVAYEVRGKSFETETRKILWLKEEGFETLKKYIARIKCRGRTHKDIANAVKNYMNRVDREKLPFDVDGVVFKLNDISVSEAMGTTDSEGKRPKANRAIKFPTEQKETILKDIEWSIGRTGSLTPVGLLEAVRLAGTTVQRVSLYNLKEMKRLGTTTYGCKVVVEKAGDIIPKIVRKIADGTRKIQSPVLCPLCESKLEWDETQTTKFCKNDLCPAQVNGKIENWFKKIGVKGIGEGIIKKLTEEEKNSYDNPIVSKISDMYGLKNYTNELSSSFGDKAFSNILTSINSVKEISLAKFIEALGIGKIGTMAKELTAIAPTIEDINQLTTEDIVKIDGFSDIKANSFLNGWKTQRKEISKILQHINIIVPKKTSNKLNGKKFCITGSLSKGRKEIQQMIEENGGSCSGSVSAKLDYLICGEDAGSKEDKAKKLGIKIISENELMRIIGG